jgi:hypothetical protein
MDEQNILHRMLAKGDSLRSRYDNFDFEALEPVQHTYLSRLAFFSRHRERILRKFNGTNITYDVKIAFLDQHSMKLGNNIFYDLEGKRQNYVTSFEVMPVSTCILGFFIFCGYAVKTPLTSKLYKELVYSLLMGAGISYLYVWKQKRAYLGYVDEIYDRLKSKFATNPILSTMKEDEQIIKNFGLTKFADFDDTDDDEDPDNVPEPGIFDGDPSKEREEYKERLIDYFYGK